MTASHALSQLSYAPELGTMISILGRPPNVNINFLLFQYFFQGSCRGRKPRPECGLRGLRHLKEERENCRDDPKPGFRQPGPDGMFDDPWRCFPCQGREECRMRTGDTRLSAEGQGGAVTWEGRSPGSSPDPGGTEREGARPFACRGGILLMGWEGRAPATGARSLRWGALPPGT